MARSELLLRGLVSLALSPSERSVFSHGATQALGLASSSAATFEVDLAYSMGSENAGDLYDSMRLPGPRHPLLRKLRSHRLAPACQAETSGPCYRSSPSSSSTRWSWKDSERGPSSRKAATALEISLLGSSCSGDRVSPLLRS